MAKRRGPSISIKMIMTTTFLILVIVGLFGFLSILNIQRIYDDQAKRQQEIFEQSTRDHGSSQIDTLGEGVITPLKGNEYAAIHPVLIRAKEHDALVRHIWLVDAQGRRVASSSSTNNTAFLKTWEQDPEKVGAFKHPLLPAKFVTQVKGGAETAPAPKKPPKGAMKAPRAKTKPAPTSPAKRKGSIEQVLSRITNYKGERVMVVGRRLAAEGVYLGSLFVVYSMERLKEQQARIQHKKERDFSKSWQYTALVGAIFIAIGLLIAVFQGIRISKPIRSLAARASQIAQGDLQTRVEITSSDELGLLAENFNFMADQLLILLHETANQATVQKELEVARNIQEALVPSEEVVDRPFLRLAGYFEPASECGGDWWTYHDLEDGKVLVVIGDVTGHGVPSAMITAAAKSAVDTLRAVTNDNLTVTYLLEILNRAIFESAKRKFVMTCFASIVDPKTNTITFANAGHNFPYIYREDGGHGKFNVLMTRGNRLGDMEESTYSAKQEELKPNDVIIWYTDGIVECESEIGEEYGEKRFRNSIRKLSSREPHDIRDGVVNSARSFFGNMPHKDDITMVIGKFYEPGTAPPLEIKPKEDAEASLEEAASAPPAEPTEDEEGQKETTA